MNIAKQKFKHYLSIHKSWNQLYLLICSFLFLIKNTAIKKINMIILKD
jgi:hypothetical protein